MPDKAFRQAPARPAAARPARQADPDAVAQTGVPPRKRSGHRHPGPAASAEERDLAARRLRYAYAVGELDIGQLAGRLADARTAGAGELTRLTEGLPPPPPRPGRPGDFHRSYPVDLSLLDELGAVEDPLARAVSAAAAADAAAARLETARQHRSLALVTANVRHGVPQVRCYDPYTGVSGRRQFHRAVRQTQANLPEYRQLWSRLQQFAADPAALSAARAELEAARAELEAASRAKQLLQVLHILDDLAADADVDAASYLSSAVRAADRLFIISAPWPAGGPPDLFGAALTAPGVDDLVCHVQRAVDAARRDLEASLAAFGYEVFGTDGEIADPDTHLIFEAPRYDPELPDGTVLRVVQRGLRHEGKLLWPATVIASVREKPSAAPASDPAPTAELAAAVAAAADSPGLAAQVAWIRDRIPRVDAEVRPGDDPDARLANAKIAIAFADYWHLRYEEARSTAETARLVFGREVRDLTDPANPARVRNVVLARLTGKTTARIAQIRTSPVTA